MTRSMTATHPVSLVGDPHPERTEAERTGPLRPDRRPGHDDVAHHFCVDQGDQREFGDESPGLAQFIGQHDFSGHLNMGICSGEGLAVDHTHRFIVFGGLLAHQHGTPE